MDITKRCIPCQGGVPKLNFKESTNFLKKVDSSWYIEEEKLIREFKFNDYSKSLAFAMDVAKLADSEGHHPYIHINFKIVKIILFTHKIGGLHENDFLMAAKIDQI